MNKKQLRYALLTKYKKLAEQKGSYSPLNLNIEQWASDALVESYGYDKCVEMLEYYFNVSSNPSWRWFANNADKIYKNLQLKEEDDRIRELMKQKAKDWLGG